MPPEQLPDHLDDHVVGAGVGVLALGPGLAERRAYAVDEDHVPDRGAAAAVGGCRRRCGHGVLLTRVVDVRRPELWCYRPVTATLALITSR
ncbi:hypothetical protein GCM10023222_53390 [Saccharopolyspora cebuensis]